jgi:predicted small integral membrane protein
MDRATKKATIIVAVLFLYMAGMTIWGYSKGTVEMDEALLSFSGMCLILVFLWFAYRKRQRYRDERRNERK